MTRWVYVLIYFLLGLFFVAVGMLVPTHIRAVDVAVLRAAGMGTPSLVDRGQILVEQQQLSPARLVLEACRMQAMPGRERLALAIDDLSRTNPVLRVFGNAQPLLLHLFGTNLPAGGRSQPFTEFAIRQKSRDVLLDLLESSKNPGIQEVLRTRALTNTTVFPPSASASGQAFDAALAMTGFLLDGGYCSLTLSNHLVELATRANHNESPQPFEESLTDVMSLGQRLDWAQLALILRGVPNPAALHSLAYVVRKNDGNLPNIFSAGLMAGSVSGPVQYVLTLSQTGARDLGIALRYNSRAIVHLCERKLPVYQSRLLTRLDDPAAAGALISLLSDFSWREPWFALALKWLLYLVGGLCLAAAVQNLLPAFSSIEAPLRVRGFTFARECLFALGFLLVVLLLSEPFLALDSQKAEQPFRLRLTTVGKAVPHGAVSARSSIMNQLSLITLLLFFVLQGLLYTASVVKLAEIRRQHVPPRMKLRLLENEDHLFDAGLYLGFVGTIISLILVSLNVIKPSLMAAYSSTSFGIIFVTFFKIFHLRPARRRLLMEAEIAADRMPAEMTP